MASDHPNNNMGNERSGGSSNSSSSNSSGKKGKNKSGGSNSDKPKQPQRGLGVAQLEKIRLHSQLASCGFIPSPQHPFCPAMPFPNTTFQHMQEEMRMHAGYQAALQQANAMSFGYSPPPPPVVGSSPSYGYHPGSFMMGIGDPMERASNIRYGTESQACNTARWNPNNNVIHVPESHQYAQPPGMVTRHLLSHVENSRRSNLFDPMAASSRNPEPNEKEELDLELKL